MKAKGDCSADYAPGSKPLVVRVESSVSVLFGKAIETATRGAARELGITTGSITIEDNGALDYVVAARVEAAIPEANAQGEMTTGPSVTPIDNFPIYTDLSGDAGTNMGATPSPR